MKLLKPVDSIRQQKIDYFNSPKVENVGSPIFVFALPGIIMLIKCCAVKSSQSVFIFGKVSRNPVQYYANIGLVAFVNEIAEIIRVAKTAGWSKITGNLVAPGGIIGMFCNWHQFDMRIVQIFQIRNQVIGKLAVREVAGIFVCVTLPGSRMDLVNCNSFIIGLNSL